MLPRGAERDVFPIPGTNPVTYIQGTGWTVFILPQIEQENLYRQYRFDLAWNNTTNLAFGNNKVITYQCPSGPNLRSGNTSEGANGELNWSTHYYGVMGPAGPANPTTMTFNSTTYSYTVGDVNTNAAWTPHGMLSQFRHGTGSVSTGRNVRLTDVIDGLSNTLMVAELSKTPIGSQPNVYRSWIRGNNGGSGVSKCVTNPINATTYNGSNNFNEISFGSNHTGGCNFLNGDGSTRFLRDSIDLMIYRASSSMSSGEVANLE
jgi:hypothetical protein